MKSVALASIVFSIALVLGGCNRGTESKEALRQAVVDHLSQRGSLNLNSMQIDVVSVSFRQNEADAAVSFRPKGSSDGGMTMNYTLQRQGNRWVVKGRSDSGGSSHGGTGGQMPDNMPPGNMQPGNMPPGHPSIGETKPPEAKK